MSLRALNLLQHLLLVLVVRTLPHWSEQFKGGNVCSFFYLQSLHGAWHVISIQ